MIPINPDSIGDPNTTPVVYVGEEVGEVLGIRQRDEPVLTVAWLVQALGIVRQVSEFNEGYNPSTLAALHWGEKAVQRIADLEAEVAALRAAALPTQEDNRGHAG